MQDRSLVISQILEVAFRKKQHDQHLHQQVHLPLGKTEWHLKGIQSHASF